VKVDGMLPRVVLRAPARGNAPGWFMSINGVEMLGVRAASVETAHDGMTVVRMEFYAHVNTADELEVAE